MIDAQIQDDVGNEHDDSPGAVLYGELKGVLDPNIIFGFVGLTQPHGSG